MVSLIISVFLSTLGDERSGRAQKRRFFLIVIRYVDDSGVVWKLETLDESPAEKEICVGHRLQRRATEIGACCRRCLQLQLRFNLQAPVACTQQVVVDFQFVSSEQRHDYWTFVDGWKKMVSNCCLWVLVPLRDFEIDLQKAGKTMEVIMNKISLEYSITWTFNHVQLLHY